MREFHIAQGAKVADDGIPLYYTDLPTEYRAIFEGAILLDRSHEARIRLTGKDRAELIQRISTNDVLNLAPGEGRPTIFTNPNGRVLDRVEVYHYPENALMLLGGPGRGEAVANYVRRNIFFQDDVQVEMTPSYQFDLHGQQADAVAAVLSDVGFLTKRKPYIGSHWTIITPIEGAESVWMAILEAGKPFGLIPAGSLTFNTLRIQAGQPGVGRELTADYIPLELGLWDEISFSKGCYTGQEIIARMESRNRLAKTIVALTLPQMVNAPADVLYEGKRVGTLTSSVQAPDGVVYGIGLVKPSLAKVGGELQIGGFPAKITALPGVQPALLADSES